MCIQLNDIKSYSITDLANLSPIQLMRLQQQADNEFRDAKAMKQWIDGAISQRFRQTAQTLRQNQGKDTGTVYIKENYVSVAADLPKKTEWDQDKLSVIYESLRAAGEDPDEYLNITFKVDERKYTSWPEHIREQFTPARTLKTGKPIFILRPAKGEAA